MTTWAIPITEELAKKIEKALKKEGDPTLTPRLYVRRILYEHFDLEPPMKKNRRRLARRDGNLRAIGVSLNADQWRIVSFAASASKMTVPAYAISQLDKESYIYSELAEPMKPFGTRTKTMHVPSAFYEKPADKKPMAFNFVVRVTPHMLKWIERRSEERGDISLAAVAREIIVGGATHDQDQAMQKVGA